MPWRNMLRGFRAKMAAGVLLAVLAERLVMGPWVVPVTGSFAMALLAAMLILRFDWLARLPTIAAVGFALLLIDDPSLLTWTLFLAMLALAVMLPRMRRFDDALAWWGRLTLLGVVSLVRPLTDMARLWRVQRRRAGVEWGQLAQRLAVPLGGGLLFLGLFAVANPLVEALFTHWRLGWMWEAIPHLIVAAFAFLLAWGFLRPAPIRLRPGRAPMRKRSRAA